LVFPVALVSHAKFCGLLGGPHKQKIFVRRHAFLRQAAELYNSAN
jgi:hypothetical protein